MKTIEEFEAEAAKNRQWLAQKGRLAARLALGLGLIIGLLTLLQDEVFTATATSLTYRNTMFVGAIVTVVLGILCACGFWFQTEKSGSNKLLVFIGIITAAFGVATFETNAAHFDLKAGTATVGYTRVFGHVEQTFALKDLRAVVLEASPTRKGGETYRICFEVGSACVPLSGSSSTSSHWEEHAEELHRWLNENGYPVENTKKPRR